MWMIRLNIVVKVKYQALVEIYLCKSYSKYICDDLLEEQKVQKDPLFAVTEYGFIPLTLTQRKERLREREGKLATVKGLKYI
jgi:hypothetical protein